MHESPDLPLASLKRLARGLLYDRGRAEDVVQEAWLAALRRGPPAEGLRAWLAEAVRRIARATGREELRRAARERRAARPEALPSAAEASARIEVVRRLLDAVDALGEPYRTAIVLRFFEELPPREIARRLGVPVNTARTHVRRGLERLRRDLDGERGGDRQSCLAVLAPLAGRTPWALALRVPADSWPASHWNGVLLVQKKLALALVAAVLLGLAFVVARSWSEGSPGPGSLARSDAPAPPASAGVDAGEALEPAPLGGEPARREPAAVAPAPDGTWIVRGHARRGQGESFPGLALVGRVHAGPRAEGVPLLEARLRADEAGDFAWALDPPGELVTVSLAPSAADCILFPTSDVFLPGDPAPQRWIVSALPLDCSVRGLVRDAEGSPVAGARLEERDRMEAQAATTDASGRYLLRVAAGSERRIRVCATGFAQQSFTIDALRTGEIEAPDVVLAPELRMRGRVLDEEGTPIAGATVEPGHPFFLVSASTDEDGAFELGTLDLDAEYLSIEARKEGFLPVSVRIEREARTAPLELRLTRGVRLTGRVVDPGGAPVWGAWISAGFWPWADPRNDTYSDRDGRFALEHVPTGKQHVWLWRTGWAQQRVDLEIPAGVSTFDVAIELEDGHSIGGVVVDEAGRPVPWAMVYADDPDPRAWPERISGFQSHAGPDGRYSIDGLPPMAITLGALAEGRARVEQRVDALDRDDVVLTLVRAAGLAGRVVDDATGAPVPSFVVRVGFPPPGLGEQAVDGFPAVWGKGVTFSDADGVWRLEHSFEAGQAVAITVEAAGYAPATADVVRTAIDPDPSAFVLRLARGTAVRGRVVDQRTGAPIEGARIRRTTARVPFESLEHTDEPVLEARTDASGRFELLDVPSGAMSLAVEPPGGALTSDGPFEVLGGAALERWIEIAPGAVVHGRLLDGDGRGLAGEVVGLSCLEGVERTRERHATTEADGGFRLEGLSPGTYHLRWERTLGETTIYDLFQRLDLEPGEQLELDLRPRGRATLTGTLEYDGDLPEVVRVTLTPRPEPGPDGSSSRWAASGRAELARDGHFELRHLEPGHYRVSAHLVLDRNLLAMGYAEVDVPEEGEVAVTVRLEHRR